MPARLAAIKKAGLEPIIRVVARGLTEDEALLVEKTLLHKLGKSLTNISSGHFADKFRPQDTLHQELSGFDFQTGVYYFNVGQGEHRQWIDCMKYGFISAGQGPTWARAIAGFNVSDIFAAYLKSKGFVGIGRIKQRARPIREVKIGGRPLISLPLVCQNMDDNIDIDEMCEWTAVVDWIKAVSADAAISVRGRNLFTTTHVRASLDNQPATRAFLEKEFEVNFAELAR